MRTVLNALCASLVICSTASAAAERYRVIEMRRPDTLNFVGRKLDEDGVVYGHTVVNGVYTPATWSPQQGVSQIPIPTGYDYFSVAGVSEPTGLRMGFAHGYFMQPARWSPQTGYVFQDYATGTTNRGVEVRDGNDSGTMVGQEFNIDVGYYYGNAIYYPDGTTESQPQGGFLVGIANDGTIVGYQGGPGSRITVRTPDRVWQTLPYNLDSGVTAWDINEVGQIVGAGQFNGGQYGSFYRTILYRLGEPGFRVIPTLGTYYSASNIMINDHGTVVSSFTTAVIPGGPTLYRPEIWSASTGVRSLNSLLDDEATALGYHIATVYSLNNRGEMVASAYRGTSSQTKYVLLQPVPEPASLLTLGLGLVAVAYRWKRGKV